MNVSLFKDSYHTFAANIVTQVIGIISFLILPNLLSVEHFAVTVFVSILLYYAGFADLGLLFVYGRKAPGMIAQGQEQELRLMEDSIQLFWHLVTLVFSLGAGCAYYYKYGHVLDAVMVAAIINLTPLFTFYLQKKTVRGGFAEFKRLTIVQSVSRILIVGGAYAASLRGWLIGSIAAIIAVFVYSRNKEMYRIKLQADPFLYLTHIPEGVILAFITMIWGTLLMIGRVFSVFVGTDETVAQYGIINSGYQMITAAVISIFLPITVKIYTMCAGDLKDLLWFVFRIQLIITPIITVGTFILVDFTPALFSLFFAKYSFDSTMIKLIMMSLLALPFLVTVGSILIGKQLSKSYLSVLLLIFVLSLLFLYGTVNRFSALTPAITQFLFLSVTAVGLMLLTWYFFSQRTVVSLVVFFSPFAMILLLLMIKYGLKGLALLAGWNPLASEGVADGITLFSIAGLFLVLKRKTVLQEKIQLFFFQRIPNLSLTQRSF